MRLRRLVPALVVAAATPLLMAPHIITCPACAVEIFHDELREDSAWHEVALQPGQVYVVDAIEERGIADVELIGLDTEILTSCATFGQQQTCGVVAPTGGTLGILVDSSTASSQIVVAIRLAE